MNIKERQKFDEDIESYMRNKNIFKNRLSYLIQGILLKSEIRLDAASKKVTAETAIHNELDILDTAIKQVFLNCTNSCRKDSNLLDKIEKYFADVERYNIVRNYFILNCNEKAEMKINGKNVVFEYDESFKGLEALNLYNKLNCNQNKNKQLFEKLRLDKKTGKPDKDIYEFIRNSYLKEIQEFNNIIEFSKYNVKEFYDVYIAIYSYVLINKLHNLHYDDFNPFYMDCDKLLNKIKQLTNLPLEKIELIAEDLTFSPKQKLDIICTPLIKILDIDNKPSYITTSSLFSNSNIERNTLVLLDNKYKINNKNFKEEALIQELIEIIKPYDNICCKFNVKIPKANSNESSTDADMVLYDSRNNCVIISELKNFIRADTISEHLNVQGRKENEGLNKGFKQITRVKDYYLSNYTEFLSRCFDGKKFTEMPVSCLIIISKNNLAMHTNSDVKILDIINFSDLLKKHKGNLINLTHDINSNVLIPKYGVDYWDEQLVMNFAGYNIYYPMFKLKHRIYV